MIIMRGRILAIVYHPSTVRFTMIALAFAALLIQPYGPYGGGGGS